MTTYKQIRMAALALLLCASAVGCKKSETAGGSGGKSGSSSTGGSSSTTTGGGGSTSSAGSSGGAAKMCVNTGDDNLDCPQIPPLTGDCSDKGPCCHRASNAEREKLLGPDDNLVLEYRLNYFGVNNHPKTIGSDLVKGQNTQVYDTEQQSQLWRFELPRKGGMEVSGMGKTTIGVGRYNCNGTYSYYSDKAAPAVDAVSKDPARWAPTMVDSMVDVTKTGIDRMKISFANNKNRKLAYTPFENLSTFMYDWEAVSQGFTITALDTSKMGRDCDGSRGTNTWTPAAHAEVYTPLKFSNAQVIASIGETLGALTSFGIASDKTLDPLKTPRCTPGSSGCAWVKLPDGLCPVDDAEMALFGCHLGAKGNVNGEMGYPSDADLKCSADKPTSAADPDMGNAGQCCDPMGDPSATPAAGQLPACNAYRLTYDIVAAAATITKDPSDTLQPDCTKAM